MDPTPLQGAAARDAGLPGRIAHRLVGATADELAVDAAEMAATFPGLVAEHRAELVASLMESVPSPWDRGTGRWDEPAATVTRDVASLIDTIPPAY